MGSATVGMEKQKIPFFSSSARFAIALENNEIQALSAALKDMMRKELLTMKEKEQVRVWTRLSLIHRLSLFTWLV